MAHRIHHSRFSSSALLAASLLLGPSPAGNALTIGTGGEVLLVPYVLCATDGGGGAPIFNTHIGITTEPLPGGDIYTLTSTAPLSGQVAVPAAAAPSPLRSSGGLGMFPSPDPALQPTPEPDRNVSWVFLDAYGNKRIDGSELATANDFVGIDWCASGGATAQANGVPGYMFITSDPRFRMWGQAYLIHDIWASMALIPVIALDDANGVNVNRPPHFGRVNELGRDHLEIALRYFLDPALAAANEFVFWFDRPCPGGTTGAGTPVCNRTQAFTESFDTQEVFYFSSVIDLSDVLNVYHFGVGDPGGSLPGNDPWIAGMIHDESQNPDAPGYGEDFVNAGHVVFDIPEDRPSRAGTVPGADYPRHVVFNLMFIASPDNASQVQTELGQERGYR